MNMLIVAFGLLLFASPEAFHFGPFKPVNRMVEFKTSHQRVEELRALAMRGKLFMYGGRLRLKNPRALSIKRAWSRPKMVPRRGASFGGQLGMFKDWPREKRAGVNLSGEASIGGGHPRSPMTPRRVRYIAAMLVLALALYFSIGAWSAFLPFFLMVMPYPYDSWSGGYSIVNGRDSRSDTTYMYGRILAATQIRISSEFDSALSYTAGIQEAIDDVPATGGCVLIPAGTHLIYTPILPKDDVQLIGLGPSTILKAPDSSTKNFVSNANIGDSVISLDGVTGLVPGAQVTFYDAGLPWPLHYGEVQGITHEVVSVDAPLNQIVITPVLSFALTVANGARLVENNNIIYIKQNNDRVVVSSLQIDGNKANRDYVYPRDAAGVGEGYCACGIYIAASDDCLIKECILKNNPMHNASLRDVGADGPYRNTIITCQISGPRDKGVLVLGCYYTQIIGNRISGSVNEVGIATYSLANYYCFYKDNIVFDNPDKGISVNGMHGVCTGNICYNNDEGISVDPDCKYWTVSNNNCHANKNGIYIYGVSAPNTLCANVCDQNTLYGIICNGDYQVIEGNTCTRNNLSGIALVDSGGLFPEWCICKGNMCTDNAVTSTYAGIYITGHNNLIDGNISRDTGSGTQDKGIDVRGNYNRFIGNDIRNNVTGALYDTGIDNFYDHNRII